ncbi:MAG: ABC transporter ATP-binding protein [Bulleidia sp.]|nr:ABC transporter ATP-binding protein [Bulleidia sp.]
MSNIEIQNLQKSYGTHTVIKDISLTIENGSRVVILGPSGAGKTTLLRLIAGLETVSMGQISFDDTNKNVAMIFQNGGLFEHAKVKDNITLGLKKLGYTKEEINNKLIEVASLLHIESLLDRYPVSLSAGEKQRVGIARAIIRNPSVLLLDEPFSNLDEELSFALKRDLLKMQESLNMTMIVVTHNIEEAFFFSEKIGLLKDGILLEYNSIEKILDKPSCMDSLLFLFPDINRLNGKIHDKKLYINDLYIQDIDEKDADIIMLIKKEAIELDSGNIFAELEHSSIQKNGYINELELGEYNLNCYTANKVDMGKKNISFTDYYLFLQNGQFINHMHK